MVSIFIFIVKKKHNSFLVCLSSSVSDRVETPQLHRGVGRRARRRLQNVGNGLKPFRFTIRQPQRPNLGKKFRFTYELRLKSWNYENNV